MIEVGAGEESSVSWKAIVAGHVRRRAQVTMDRGELALWLDAC